MTLDNDILQDTVNAYHGNGCNQRATSRHLGVSLSTVQRRLEQAQSRGIEFQPEHALPAGHDLAGVSRYYDKNGKPGGFWVKARKDLEREKLAMLKTAQALTSDLPPVPKVERPDETVDDLLSCYILTDFHLGQLSWGEETGADWNTDIAEELLVSWFAAAIKAAPAAKKAVLVELGDFLHSDGLLAITPTSGNILDADARFGKIVTVCIRALRRIVQMLLEKHDEVHIILAEGNHDLASSVWLRAMFAAFYEKEPRVTVDNTQVPYYAVEWGDTSIFIHHGHKKKLEDVSRVFAGQYREIFGRTKYSYAHLGHMHHVAAKEDQLMIVRQHPTLAAKDAHSARLGYQAQRGASVITYSKKFGEVSEIMIKPEMVQC